VSTHGPLYDEFHAQAGHPHNGAQHDSFHAQRGSQPHGLLVEEGFRAADPSTPGGHGEHWDSFPWQAMPLIHGAHYDSDFATPALLDGVEHGTWYDVFRGGHHEVQAIVDGKDVQAQVIECHGDHVKLRKAGGEIVEAALSQLRAFRGPAPSRSGVKAAQGIGHTDAPITASSADAPSAHDATASGGHLRGVGKTIEVDELAEVAKSMAETRGSFSSYGPRANGTCASCGNSPTPVVHVPHFAGGRSRGRKATCSNCFNGTGSVGKSVDASETALQTQGGGGTVGHRTGCPRGGSAPCGAEKAGLCTICKAQVHDHQAIGKSDVQLVDVLKSIEDLQIP
jgi:hypothetical protein